MLREAGRGALAGAAGTTALAAVTYLDMAARARPASRTPEESVERLSGAVGVRLPGDDDARDNRVSGLGALTGIATGVAVGTAYGLLRALGVRPSRPVAALGISAVAMLAANGPMAALGVSNLRQWASADWAADALPHLAYGLVTALAYDGA